MVLAQDLDQCKRINPKTNPCIYGQLIYYRRRKNIQWGKDSLFNKWCYENWTDNMQKDETRLLSYTTYKETSNWIKDINVRPKAIKLLE